MSVRSVPPFDMLSGQQNPYDGFGAFEIEPKGGMQKFRELIDSSRSRIEESFRGNFQDAALVPELLDGLISEMWKTGWNPKTNNLNLFVTDFGAMLADAVIKIHSGKLVFRSDVDVSHLSVWWSNAGVEFFPFHTILKALSHSETTSIKFTFKGLAQYLDRN